MKKRITNKPPQLFPNYFTWLLIAMVLLLAGTNIYFAATPIKVKPAGFYYLKIPDSPHVAHPTLELDYTENDTAYLNWYWKDDTTKFSH